MAPPWYCQASCSQQRQSGPRLKQDLPGWLGKGLLGLWASGPMNGARSSMWSSTQIIGRSQQPGSSECSREMLSAGSSSKWNWKGWGWQTKGRAFSQTQSLRWPFCSHLLSKYVVSSAGPPGPEVLSKECHTLGVTKERLSHTHTVGQPCITSLGQCEAQSASVCSSPQAFCLPRSALGAQSMQKELV